MATYQCLPGWSELDSRIILGHQSQRDGTLSIAGYEGLKRLESLASRIRRKEVTDEAAELAAIVD